MGNENSLARSLKRSRLTFNTAVDKVAPCCMFYSCSYETWLKRASVACNCADKADYNYHEGDYRERLMIRSDTTEGRFIRATLLSPIKLRLEEIKHHTFIEVFINEVRTSGRYKRSNRQNFRSSILTLLQQTCTKDGINVIGCHGSLAVVQLLDRKGGFVPEFYFIDMAAKKFLGKFFTTDCEMIWYECYISPDESHVILRPDALAYEAVSSHELVKTKVYNITVISMRGFLNSGGHALAFDYRHGSRYIFAAKDADIFLYDLYCDKIDDKWENLGVPAPMHQLKTSPSGMYLAARCLFPTFSLEHKTNTICVFACDTMQLLLAIDVKGPHWRSTQLINMHIFPQFSACEKAIAVMKNCPSKRKVLMYRMPNRCFSLLHWCRINIRRFTTADEVSSLLIPSQLKKYLLYKL